MQDMWHKPRNLWLMQDIYRIFMETENHEYVDKDCDDSYDNFVCENMWENVENMLE